MADATITAAQVGAYERPLTANTVYTIDVVPANTVAYAVVAIFNHGTAPVFVKAGGTVTVDDATADIIPPGTYIERQVEHKGATATIAAISGSAGSVSVARSPRPHPLGAAASGGAGGGTVTLAGGTATVGQVGAASTVVSGTLGALNATLDGTTDLGQYGQVRLQVTGTFTGTITFQVSNDGATWITKTLNTPAAGAGNTAPITGLWFGDIGARYFRPNMTAYTSGTATVTIQYSSQPAAIPASTVFTLASSTFKSSGTAPATTDSALVVTQSPNAVAAASAFSTTSAASTNATSVKAAAGNLLEVTVSNPTATAAYFKLYNKASAPTVGTDTPVATYRIAATGSAGDTISVPCGIYGKRFSTGLAWALTGAAAATDTTAAVAGVQIHGTYL
jgi:hypothetical protein